MIRYGLYIGLSISFGLCSFAQPKEVTLMQLAVEMKREPRPIVVFLYTDWCSYCTLMDRKVFRDQHIVNKLDSEFYFVKFNAESEYTLTFNDRTYLSGNKKGRMGSHEFARALSRRQIYPALIFIDQNMQVIYRHLAYIKARELDLLLSVISTQIGDTSLL